jgi:hypothetical protein
LDVGIHEPQIELVAQRAPEIQDVIRRGLGRTRLFVVEDEVVLARAAGELVDAEATPQLIVARPSVQNVLASPAT